MVRLTDADCKALEILGESITTREQVNAVLDIFSGQGQGTSEWRYYRHGTIDAVSLNYNAIVDGKCVCLSTITGDRQATIETIVRSFIWGGVCDCFNITLSTGNDPYDYILNFTSKDTTIWGGFFFRLSRTPYEIIN
jgi:hypothetical protein